MEYSVYLWSAVAASIISVFFCIKFSFRSSSRSEIPSLFENIHFMKNELVDEIHDLPRKRTASQSSRRRRRSTESPSSSSKSSHQNVADLLSTLGIISDESLQRIIASFKPLNVGQQVKINSLIDLQNHIIVVQNGEVKVTVQDGDKFHMSTLVKNGELIYSKLAVINFLLGFKHHHPEDVPMLETTKATTLLILPFSVLKSLTTDEAVICSISTFIAEVQKIVIDALFGELCIPLPSMFKYETPIDEQMDVPQFLAEKLDFPNVDFLAKNLVKFHLTEAGESLSINGFSHDIGLVLITKGSVEVCFTDRADETRYIVKNSWYGFVSLLSSPTGTPFPKSYAKEKDVEGYILTRTAFKEMVAKHPSKAPMRKAAQRILKSLSPFVAKLFYTFQWTTVQGGTALIAKHDPVTGVYAVIRGRLRKQGQKNQDDYFLIGVFDCILERPHRHSVIAARASELCFIPSQVIKAVKTRYPTVQNRLVKALGESLLQSWKHSNAVSFQFSNAKKPSRSLKIKGVTLFAATSDVQLSRIASELVIGMSLVGVQAKRISSRKIQEQVPNLSNLDPLNNPHLLAWLRDQERSHQVLVFQCDQALTPWTKWCLSEADTVIDLCLASKGPFVSAFESEVFEFGGLHSEFNLVLLHSPETVLPRGTADWLYRRKSHLNTHYHVRLAFNEPITLHSDIARLGRHLLGLDVGLVLGGGGARGAAHVGMLKAIQEMGIPIDRVGGVSIGAMIGGLWCIHRNYAKMKELAEEWFELIGNRPFSHILNITYPHASPFSGDYFNTTVKVTMGENVMIEDLWLPYYCCSTDISVLSNRIHKSGWLWRYCRASMSYCWVCPPICDPRDGHLLVDGCYTENVPGRAMKETGVKYILALDIAAIDERNLTNFGDTLSGTWAILDRINPFGRPKYKIPNQEEIQLRVAFCSHYRNLEELQNDPDYEYLCPDLGSYTSSDFLKFKPIYELGYNYATTYLAGIRKLGKS